MMDLLHCAVFVAKILLPSVGIPAKEARTAVSFLDMITAAAATPTPTAANNG